MQSWKTQVNRRNIDVILIQETHVEDEDETIRLEKLWCQVWGKVWNKETPWSFWSYGSSRKAGVAILLNPHTVQDKYTRETQPTDIHTMILTSQHLRIINTYAPAAGPRQREYYQLDIFSSTFNGQTMWGGDFNCVIEKEWDRHKEDETIAKNKTGELELQLLLDKWKLIDSLAREHRNDIKEKQEYREAYHTYGNARRSSRLDRFYMDKELFSRIQWQRALQPGNHTDHKGYIIQFQNSQRIRRTPSLYKGKDKIPQEMQNRLKLQLRMELQGPHTIDTYQGTLRNIISILTAESKRAKLAKKRSKSRKIRRQARFEGVKPQIVKAKLEQMEARQRSKRWDRQRRDEQYSTDFFARIQDYTPIKIIHDITKSNGEALPTGTEHTSIADKMAEGWQHIMNPTTTQSDRELEYALAKVDKVTEWQNKMLIAPITRKELNRSVQKMKKRKAGGTDRLNNDFFIEFAEETEDWLLETFNDIMSKKRMPTSFAEAKVITIPKGGDPTDALQYRPIALLQTPYKIFTRIIADRLIKVLPSVISESQHGFLTDRQMEDAINTVQAVLTTQSTSHSTKQEDSAIMLSIDFAKAYDSLKREFLWKTMRRFGFHEEFIGIIQSIHEDTTVRFETNGQLSKKRRMTAGIRQGCPLAPLLFIIGTEPLTKMINQDKTINGIELTDGPNSTNIRIIGYVDDTMLTLQKASMLTRARFILEQFSKASGLRIQQRKCTGIWLNQAIKTRQYQGFNFIQQGESLRYLGIHITERNSMPTLNWKKRIEALRRSLVIATQRTTTVEQRAMIITAIAEPQIKFTASYIHISRPQMIELKRMLKGFLWIGSISQHTQPRGRINEDIIALPRKEGGLNIKNIATIIDEQVERKVFRWALHPPGIKRIVGAVLLHGKSASSEIATPILSPSLSHNTGTRYNLWSKGRGIIEHKLALKAHRDMNEIELTRQMLDQANWTITWTNTKTACIFIHPQAQNLWTELISKRWKQIDPIARSYWHMKANYNPWIIDVNGQTLTSRWGSSPMKRWYDIRKTDSNSFIIHWKGEEITNRSTWQVRNDYIILTLLNARGFKPHRTYPSNTALRLMNDRSSREWTTTNCDYVQWKNINILPPPLNQTIYVEQLQTGAENNYVQFELHPSITRIIIEEDQRYIYCPRKHHFNRVQKLWKYWKTKTLQPPTTKILTNLTRRRAIIRQNEISQPTNWSTIWKAPYEDASSKMNRYIWLHQAYNTYTTTAAAACTQCQETETISHIMWNCTIAKQTWMQIVSMWGIHSNTPNILNQYKQHIWADQAPMTSSTAKQHLYHTSQDIDAIHDTMNELWGRLTILGKRHLWTWRNRRVWDNQQPNLHQYQHELSAALRAELYHLTGHPITKRAQLYTRLYTHHATIQNQTLTAPAELEQYRLFFDGGSRKNPGRAGSGCVIQKWTAKKWILVWGAAVSLGTATNNQAELIALLTGLQCATRHTIRRLTIIGDSQLILNQIQNRNKIHHKSLRKLHAEVKYHLSQLAQCHFHHTRRTHNKMADSLANYAMDSGASNETIFDDHGTSGRWLPAAFSDHMSNDNNYTITQPHNHQHYNQRILPMDDS